MPFARGHIIVTYSEIFPPALLNRTKFFNHCRSWNPEFLIFQEFQRHSLSRFRIGRSMMIPIFQQTLWMLRFRIDLFSSLHGTHCERGKSVYRDREEFAYRTHTHLSSVFRFKIRGCSESVTSRRIRLRCRFKATVSYMAAS